MPSHSTILSILILTSLPLLGHSDLSETIQTLNKKITQRPSAELYLKRALEYRALRIKKHAIEDLQSALKLQPDHHLALTSLIQLSPPASLRKLALIHHYHSLVKNSTKRVEATQLLAQYFTEADLPHLALPLCEKLQSQSPDQKNTALDLLHAEILTSLGKHQQASRILKESWQRTHSIVLRNQWIDAALTARHTTDCLPIIEQELATSRFLSSWLIRRARAALILGDSARAHTDLNQALAEISTRLRPAQPDLTLIADRALAHALLGQHQQARQDLQQLKKSSLPPATYRLLQQTLREN